MGFRSLLLVSKYFLKEYSSFHMPVFSQTIECILTITTKAVKKRAESLFELNQKWCLFLQLAAEKKTPFLVQLKQIFGPFCDCFSSNC